MPDTKPRYGITAVCHRHSTLVIKKKVVGFVLVAVTCTLLCTLMNKS